MVRMRIPVQFTHIQLTTLSIVVLVYIIVLSKHPILQWHFTTTIPQTPQNSTVTLRYDAPIPDASVPRSNADFPLM